MRKESLLDKAKKVQRKIKSTKDISSEDIELALAWSRNEVSISQVMSVYDSSCSSVYIKLAIALKVHLLNNQN